MMLRKEIFMLKINSLMPKIIRIKDISKLKKMEIG